MTHWYHWPTRLVKSSTMPYQIPVVQGPKRTVRITSEPPPKALNGKPQVLFTSMVSE